MSLINDLTSEIGKYATDFCKTEIIGFSINGGGTVLNKGETFQFRVRVTNEGNLDMRNVQVLVIGSLFADVATGSGPFGSQVLANKFEILPAGGSQSTGFFRGTAKAITSGAQSIVTARINSWDASLDHILKDQSIAGAAEGILQKAIMPT
jgi:hypothetical protein